MVFWLLLLFTFNLILLSAIDLNPDHFDTEVIRDDRSWAVEFYSPMCGSCQEFTPVWESVESKLKSIASGKINIDNSNGMKLAQDLGVLDEGVPNIRLFHSNGNPKGVSIMAGDPLTSIEILKRLRKHTIGNTRRDDGFFLKTN